MTSDPSPRPAPSINLPQGTSTCQISIIDTTCDIVSSPPSLLEPSIAGHDWLNLPTYAFLIEHKPSGTRLLFDFGCRVDMENLPPNIRDRVANSVPGIRVEKEVPDILAENDIDMSSIKALILSHWHFDHSGNLGRLSPGTELLVGPGFRDAFMPGYPAKETSGLNEEDFRNVDVVEVPFDGDQRTLELGDYQAYDYFGDGSIYILNVPGHTVAHISALVRTTPGTAMLLGGDVCHFPGVIRPTVYTPMPDPLPPVTVLDKRLQHPCPCAIFTACHPDESNARTTPFYKCASGPSSWYEDPAAATVSINALLAFDADPNILVVIAHDPAPRDVMPFFPHAVLNDWKARGWKESMQWHFVNELPVDGHAGRPPQVDGTYHRGVLITDLYGKEVTDMKA